MRIRGIARSAGGSWLGALALAAAAAGQETSRTSVGSSGEQGDDISIAARSGVSVISADGRYVVFHGRAHTLVPGDGNPESDVFLRDRVLGVTERLSVDSAGIQANGWSGEPSISADGRYVAFCSRATNLVVGDTNGCEDVFVHDRVTGETHRVSVDADGGEGDGASEHPSISADGGSVVFTSVASDLVADDGNGVRDVFVRDLVRETTERVNVDSSGREVAGGTGWWPAISADGRFVAFEGQYDDLVPGDTNWYPDVYVHDRTTGRTERVSVDATGAAGTGWNANPSISADGRFVAFQSSAGDLVAGDTNGTIDAFVHDRVTRITERVSVDSTGGQAAGDCAAVSISADGRFVAFEGAAGATLVADDTNGAHDVFVHDRATGVTERASVDSAGTQGDDDSFQPTISADGRYVAFTSEATLLVPGDTNATWDAFLRDRGAATWATAVNWGDGLAGTRGIPGLTARGYPRLGAPITLDLADSSDRYTVGLLFLGFQRTQLPTSWRGVLVVVPSITLLVGLDPWGTCLTEEIPDDATLAGLAVDLQAIELDAGAVKGVSFTPGLELLLGN